MNIFSDAALLSMLRAAKAENFETGYQSKLVAVFGPIDYLEVPAGDRLRVEGADPFIECRSSDIAAHRLIKQSPITRDADGAKFLVKRFEPDGHGMTRIILRSLA